MFNLLPEEQKKEIYTEYRFRLFILIFIFLVITGIIAIILLAPTLFLSSSEYNNLAEGLGLLQKETPELENSQNLQTTVEKTNNKLTVLQSGREQTPLLIWSKVIDDKPSGVKINSFSYSKKDKKVVVIIEGRALVRESLISFAKSLEAQKTFENVNLPVSNLAREKNLDFFITFEVGS